jgi:hypothetical protein
MRAHKKSINPAEREGGGKVFLPPQPNLLKKYSKIDGFVNTIFPSFLDALPGHKELMGE